MQHAEIIYTIPKSNETCNCGCDTRIFKKFLVEKHGNFACFEEVKFNKKEETNKEYLINIIHIKWENIYRQEWTNTKYRLHNPHNAASILTAKNGYFRLWFAINHRYTREDGPAIIIQNSKDKLRLESWFINSSPHRDNGPANIHYKIFKNHVRKTSEEFFWHGYSHRKDGPSYVKYDRKENVINKKSEWHLYGEKLDGFENLCLEKPDEIVNYIIKFKQTFQVTRTLTKYEIALLCYNSTLIDKLTLDAFNVTDVF